MSATTVRLLQAASEILGGDKALADRLGVGETLLSKLLADLLELPDPLLLRAVDIIIADRQSRLLAVPGETAADGVQELRGGD